jgi:hypothetical protein
MLLMEAHEMQEFSNQMREGGESLMTISLAISILAVLVAMVTVLGHRSHTEAVLAQARAGDKWNEYQAQKMRFDQVAVTMDLLSLQPNSNGAAVEAKLAEYKTHQAKWQAQMNEFEDQAHEFEAEVNHAEHQASRYDLGEAMLQIGVVLCSITLFTRRRLYFLMGLALGTAGVICAASGLLVH